LGPLDYLDGAIGAVSEEVDGRLAPFAQELARLDTIPGVITRQIPAQLARWCSLGNTLMSTPSSAIITSAVRFIKPTGDRAVLQGPEADDHGAAHRPPFDRPATHARRSVT